MIANEGEPVVLIEAKISETHPSPALKKFQAALDIPAVQLTNEVEGYRILSNKGRSILVAPACQWLSRLP